MLVGATLMFFSVKEESCVQIYEKKRNVLSSCSTVCVAVESASGECVAVRCAFNNNNKQTNKQFTL